MSISSIDGRYSEKLQEVSGFLGEINFVYYMSEWSLSYAECTNENTYLPSYPDKSQLFDRVTNKEKYCHHQMVALKQVLESDFPDVNFHFGLTSEDIMHNARWTQVSILINYIESLLKDIDSEIKKFESQVDSFVLAHTHGQSATPIELGPYLRAKFRRLNIVRPDFRLGGSNGQLTILKMISGKNDFRDFAAKWSNNLLKRVPQLANIHIECPNNKIALLQIGPTNEATFASAICIILKARSLARALWDHCQRGILTVDSQKDQAGSSAMPHKVNPIAFENAEGCFSNAYHILLNALEANSDSRGLRDLSNSVVNRNSSDGWVYFYLGLKSLAQGMRSSRYNQEKIISELKSHPECLTELLRYYLICEEDQLDPYWTLKENPPANYETTIARMKNWELK